MKNPLKVLIVYSLMCVVSLNISAQIDNMAVNDSVKEILEKGIDETAIFERKQFEVTEEQFRKGLDRLPSFAVYKDIFFTTGIPLNEGITRNTADALFQISIRQRLTKSYLPFNTFAYLTYTQKSFWDVYAESAPFKDNNYNPALGVGKYIIRNNKLMGGGFIQLEHESNGKDGADSRSWNYLSASVKYFYNPRLNLGIKMWLPFVDGEENKDLLDYKGLATLSGNYITKKSMWWLSAEVTPRKGWGNANTIITIAYRVSKSQNQYLFGRFYNGKGDSLLDYDKYEMNFRVGICIKPDFYSIY